ncbi:WD40-repeat-containing domain protein [Gongronella butleri]|nr:WD40-repeat-containing domain protein [Gongronella butleri]
MATKKQRPAAAVVHNNGHFTLTKQESHAVETTIQHWQLRHLASCLSNEIILLPRHNELQWVFIALFFFKKKQKLTMVPFLGTGVDDSIIPRPSGLNARLNCPLHPCLWMPSRREIQSEMDQQMNTLDLLFRHGYIAVAGPRGLAMVHKEDGTWQSGVFQTGSVMNNAICLWMARDEVRAFVCNNDQSIHVYNVPSMAPISVFRAPSAVNHIAVTSDGTQMLATSDTGVAYVYDIHTMTISVKIQSRLVSDESCVGCAWNDAGSMFAVTSQNGQVNVYDGQSHTMLCQLSSTEASATRRAARCIMFCRGPLDLLVYSEHVSQINIVDTRTFDQRQIMRLVPLEMDAHIAGVALSPNNDSLYVAMEDSMMELRLDLVSRRQFPSSTIPM